MDISQQHLRGAKRAAHTHARLKGQISDPLIAELYNDFDPVYQTYISLYVKYLSTSGIKKGKTLTVETLLLKDLIKEVPKWEAGVRAVYTEDTPEEVAIFPNKRTPFFHGTYEQRISSIGSLLIKLQADPLLAAPALQVENFYNMLYAARTLQLQKKGATIGSSSDLENQRKLVAEALWGILGRLMHKYRKNPAFVKNFFDLSLLRKKRKKDNERDEELKAA